MPKVKTSKASSFGSVILDSGPYPNRCDLFSQPVGERSIASEQVRFYKMNRQNNSLTFKIESIAHHFIVPHATTLRLKLRWRKANHDPLTAGTDEVYCVNLPGASIFSDVSLDIGGQTQTALTTDHYGYRAHMAHLMTYGVHTKELEDSTLFPRHWYREKGSDFKIQEKDIPVLDPERQPTGQTKKALVWDSEGVLMRRLKHEPVDKDFEVITPVFVDIFQGNKDQMFWPADWVISLIFTLAKPSFYALTLEARKGHKFYLDIVDAELCVKYVTFFDYSSSIKNKFLNGEKIYFPFTRENVLTFNYNAGTTQIIRSGIFNGKVPSQILIAMVPTANYLGSYTTNPYEYQHFDLTKLEVEVNGVPRVPANLKFNFEEGNYLQLYNWILENSRRGTCDRNDNAFAISYEDFKNVTVIPVNINPTLCLDTHNHTPSHMIGSLSLRMEFAKPLPAETTVMIFGQFSSSIEFGTGNEMQVFIPTPNVDESQDEFMYTIT